ncbi:MAG: hypothetical protein DCC71_18720 [Proteobacteria bacterium]|nr:MAG: hypothetical protein DCC71_18720 [Pseudomonadota bacterium]
MSEAHVPETTAPSEAAPAGRSFVERVTGVLRLDSAAYEDVGADAGAWGQAAAVVAGAAIARALAAQGGPLGGQGIAFMIQVAAIWPIASALVWLLGGWFGHPAPFARVARVMGFAMAPLLLTALAVVPAAPVQIAVAFLSTALLIATFVVGVRQALATSTGSAAFVLIVVLLAIFFVVMLFQYAVS